MKKIGLYGGVSVGIGFIVATSTFVSIATGLGEVGIWFIITMILVTAVNLMAALSIAELTALMPKLTGGLAQYTMVGTGPFLAIVIMVGGYFISNVFAGPAEGHMFALTMSQLIDLDIPLTFWSIGLTIILIVVNILGVSVSIKVQMVAAGFMILSLLSFGIIGTFQLGYGPIVDTARQMTYALPEPLTQFSMSVTFARILPMASVAFWLFIGSEFVASLGREMKDPKKNVPRAMVLTLVIMCIIKVFMAISMFFYTPFDELAGTDVPHIMYGFAILGPTIGTGWMIAVALTAAISTYNAIIFAVGEICAGMAKINLLPSVFAKTNKFNSPYIVILTLGIVSVLILATGVAESDEIQFLILTSSFFWMLAYIVSHINLLILRRRLKDVPRTFRVPFGSLFPILGIAFSVYMIWNISTDPIERINIFILSGALLLGLSIYATIWCKKYLNLPLFKSVPIDKIMAMEHPMYHIVNKKKGNINNTTVSENQ